jgi:hypothetical protein
MHTVHEEGQTETIPTILIRLDGRGVLLKHGARSGFVEPYDTSVTTLERRVYQCYAHGTVH